MDIAVLANPECRSLPSIQKAIDIVHDVQNHFRFSLRTAAWLPNSDKKKPDAIDGWELCKKVRKKEGTEPTIVVLQDPLEDDYFTNDFHNLTIVSVDDWDIEYAPPPVHIYLAYVFAGACLTFEADLSDEITESDEKFSHDPSIGCFFDAVNDKEEIKLGMVGANLCGQCETGLFEMGLTDEGLRAVEQILNYVRSAAIRRPRRMSSRIFLGHGHADAWRTVAEYLLGLHQEIEEFNRVAVAGFSTVERLNQMLERSRLAFLVMTAEDLHDDKKKHARENVVHEIGLFQGRLGFQKAIILKEASVPEFSNITGLNYISFPEDEPQVVFPEIRRILEREGLIQASRRSPSRKAKKHSP